MIMNKNIQRVFWMPCVGALMVVSAFTSEANSAICNSRTRDLAQKEAVAIEAEWAAVGRAGDVEKFVGFYAPNATLFAPAFDSIGPKENIRAVWVQLFSDPNIKVDIFPNIVQASLCGDLVYSYGTYSTVMTGPDGKPVSDKGNYVMIYRRQVDGTLKAEIDIYNSSLPAQQ
jgi:ketosteroid isomerase-like protein